MQSTKLTVQSEAWGTDYEVGEHTRGLPVVFRTNAGNSQLKIGKYCSIADGVRVFLGSERPVDSVTLFPITTSRGGSGRGFDAANRDGPGDDITIGNDVWIGRDVTILSGVHIGDGAVVEACSVVSSDVAPYTIVTGNPARLVRERFDKQTVRRLVELAWWDWPENEIAANADLLMGPRVERLIGRQPDSAMLSASSRDRLPAPAKQSAFDAVEIRPDRAAAEQARRLYLDLLVRCISNTVYGDINRGAWAPGVYNADARRQGTDWPEVAHSMIGVMRLENLLQLTEIVVREGIPGDLIETGVWRGGACILMRGVLKAYGETKRVVYVADSFQGLPAPDAETYPADAGQEFHNESFLAVSRETVAANFASYGLLDEQVCFVPGWFKDTLPGLKAEALALIRLDGDLYESTIQALDALYHKLSVGGFVIVDDYGSWPNCRQAVEDFRTANGIVDPIIPVDTTGVYWRRTR